jgi:uncharacterized protein
MTGLPEPASPCVGVCSLDPAGRHCVGCFRSLDEIAAWSGYSREDRHRVIADLARRRRDARGNVVTDG